MKNLSAIPRLSLLETFTILITLVVCLAGFTKAEVQTNYRKQDFNQQEENYHAKEATIKRNVPCAHEKSKMTENESEDKNVANYQNIPELPLEKLIKRHSDEFGESDESDEKESDGYGYDDDEYYHFNFKRNDETLENSKLEKESVHDSNEKEGVSGQKPPLMNQNAKEKTKEIETIEMLNYKESHPSLDPNGNPAPMGNAKPYSEELNRKKLPASANVLGSLRMSDLRGNSAIDEKMKERKDESNLSSASSEMKASDAKKTVKVIEDKDSVKLKDSKLTDDTDQKEKEPNLKDGKDAVVGKTIKENSKSSDDKEKNVKLSDSAKLEDNVDKIGGKAKESESPKLTREDTADITSFADKIGSEMMNPSGLNQINNRASFVSTDYKDNADKTAGVEEDEKTSEETIGMDSSLGLSEYQDELRSQEKFRKLYNERDVNANQNSDSFNSRGSASPMFRDPSKSNEYAKLAFELQNVNSNDMFKKDWKNAGLEAMRFFTQSQPQQQQQQQQQNMQNQQRFYQMQQQLSQQEQLQRQGEMNPESRFAKNFGFSFQPSELENTEYHKNYIKSLKRYKGLSGPQKNLMPPGSTYAGRDEDERNMKKKLKEAVKRRSMEIPSEEKDSAQSKHPKLRRNARRDLLSAQSLRSSETFQTLSKTANDDPKLTEGKKQEEQQEASRARRKSPVKLEYEIKVINQNAPDSKSSEFSHLTQRRFEKDLKTKLATDEKNQKKYPYSQVSREDLTRLGESEGEKKFKRKAPTWNILDQKSVLHTRAVPSGYYGNRVKFGQKSYARNNERASPDSAAVDTGHASSSYFFSESSPASADKSKLQRSWEVRQQDYKHDPMKRYDESGHMNKGNALFLVRKGQRVATAFEEGSPHQGSDSSLSPDSLAKLLSKDNDYIVLKKTDSNKFQKISEGNSNTMHMNNGALNYPNKFTPEGESLKSGTTQTLKIVRSYHNDKEDKKFSSASHSSKSNLKKTFDKFRDLAGFFKDNEQESTDNQYSAQELKEGRDIVFSEDKLPDPIVISSDGTGKSMAFSQKQPNSIYSISTNFKTLDQQDKKGEAPTSNESDKNMFTAEAKADGSESSWEPTLRNIFPEAKSINTLSKNGNEIIVLDLNRNQLKTDRSFMKPMPKAQQQYGAFGITSQVPGANGASSDTSVQMMMNPIQNKYQSASKMPQKNPYNKARNNRAFAVVKGADNADQVSVQKLDLPSLLRALSEKAAGSKVLTKRNSPSSSDSQVSDNYKKFLTELNELSELNKSSYGKGKLAKKRNAEEIILPSSSFPELSTYGDANLRYLGNLLQNIMAGGENFPEFKGFNGAQVESSNSGIPKSQEQSLKSGQMYLNPAINDLDRKAKYQRRWSSTEEKNKVASSLREDKAKDESLRSKSGVSEDKNIQDEFLKELVAASDKISRSIREGAKTRNLRNTIEESSLGEKRESGTPSASSESKSEDMCCKLEPSNLTTKEKTAFGSELKCDHNTKENSDKSLLKSNYENHLSEFFENLSSNKNQKDQVNVQNENTWKRKKRKENHRRKRSASHDVKNKVSTTAVQNTILKNLAEDNYQSVYSPGIKRRLFSTNNEADDADNYSDAYERDKNVIVEEAQPKCVKNSLNKCIDPMIVELFGTVDKEEEKNRARRSLTSGFHSNFKREIDLDESMPNDFQNFLVTSLGGFGSQNREIIKKDVALWERKESTQDAKQFAESSLPGGKEDPNSTLEKREVSSSENRKAQTYFPSTANSNSGNAMASLNHVEKKLRSDNKSKLKTSEFADDKLPTQIRIQISNASSKEKKSSKPIMDESESTSTEMENLPKEKEFFDKNKINALRLNTLPKLHNPSKTKFPFSDYEENENSEGSSSSPQSSYHPRRRRRKKKKYAAENPMKPVKDFINFDQKTMETFLKKVLTDQNMVADQTSQKSPVANHLPQVETVYNPTQGTNKAQLEISRFGKMNSANSKNTGTAKNNIQSSDNLGYDESILGNYLTDKTAKLKSEKVKEYEEIDWKPRYGKMRLRQELGWDSSSNNYQMPSVKTDTSSYSMSTDSPSYLNPFNQHFYGQKTQAPSSNYFFHPSSSSVENSNNLYETLKLKQEMKNQNTLTEDHSTSKLFKKPFHYSSTGLFKADEKERNQNSVFPNLNTGDGSWNYEYSLTKKPGARGFKGRDFLSGIKNQNHLDAKTKLTHGGSRKYLKNLDDEKSSVLDSPQSTPLLENTKDTDYMDNLGVDDDYLEDDSGKEMQTEEPLLSVPMKYHRMFNSDTDENTNEEEEESDDDYDENTEEEDSDDYSLLANTRAMDPELTKNNYRKTKFQSSFSDDSALTHLNYVYPKDNLLQFRGNSFEQMTNPKNDLKFSAGRQLLGLSDMKNDLGSLSSSTSLLKKANENSNIFNKNLMKNSYDYNSENSLLNQLPESKIELNELYQNNKLFKRKMDSKGKFKRSRESPQIGSRLFFAAKTEINNVDPGSTVFLNQIDRKARNGGHPYSRRNPFNAEFADPGNSFDESEENGNDKLLNFGKNLQEEEDYKNTDQDEEQDFEDVAENLEDDGETISEDNILENVIGKYIMRKRVASPEDLSKPGSSETERKHKLEKRSLDQQEGRGIKIVKRLSSGHLTENNFRKYHKKNFTRKREVNKYDFDNRGNAADENTTLKKARKTEKTSQMKRSALDLFKKITNKDRDNKKVENVDGRTAGFEPLSSLSDKKYESSIRDNKFDFLNQVKKISNEGPQTQIKSAIVELKQHSPHEGQFAGDHRKMDKLRIMIQDNPSTVGQGPWKIELNEKYDVKLAEFPRNIDTLKDAMPTRQDNENLKAFVVFSNNLSPYKRSPAEGLSPASGSFQKEVGNSYRPKSDEGRRISKMHVSKRSLDSSLVTKIHKEAAHTSTDHFTSGQNTETNVNIEEKNRALHDIISERDSKPQPPHVLQRNNKESNSFVIDDEQCQNARFPPFGSTNNRMSVFPPPNEANIMRDSRLLNEETSKYLGQQIVDAILSHVSENPKFKELLAPGLAARTTAYRKEVDTTTKPLQADVSELQFFLQKFMLDIEQLAEKHLRKRICTQIDDQSKQFLQSLLNVPESTVNEYSEYNVNENCGVTDDYLKMDNTEEQFTTATTTEALKAKSLPTQTLIRNSTEELENLRKKHCLLLKLMDDFDKLTKLEKDSLRVHYQYLLDELEQNNKQLGSLSPVPDSEFCSTTGLGLPDGKSRAVSESEDALAADFSISPNCTSCLSAGPSCQSGQCGSQPPNSSTSATSNPNKQPTADANEQKSKTKFLPTYSFEEEVRKQPQEFEKVTPLPIFESVDPVNMTEFTNKVENTTTQKRQPKESDPVNYSSPAPQMFDLLPFTNSTQKIDNMPFDHIPLQQSLSEIDSFKKFDNPVDLKDPRYLTELHRLSLGNAAGLQVSLKSRDPWMSNLDVAKTIRNDLLPLAESNELEQVPKAKLKESFSAMKTDKAAIDSPSVADVKDSQSSFASASDADYLSYVNPILRKNTLTSADFPNYNVEMVVPKRRSFETASKRALRNDRVSANYFEKKVPANGNKRAFLRSRAPPPPLRISRGVPKDYPQLEKKVLPLSQKVFTQSKDVLPQSSYVVFQSPEVTTQTPNVVQSGETLIHTPEIMLMSPDVQTQSSKIVFQPSDVTLQTQNIETNSPGNSLQRIDTMSQAADARAQPTDMRFQPSNIIIEAPNVKSKTPEMSFQPLQTLIKSTNDQAQSSDMTFQPSDFMMDTSNAKTKSSPEMSFQSSETTMKSTNDQAQSSDKTFESSDFMMEVPNVKTKSSEISLQPSEAAMKSTTDQPQAPETMFQPWDLLIKSSDAKTKSSPEVSYEPSDMKSTQGQPHAPETMFQQWDDAMKTPDATKSSPEVSYEPSDIKSTQGQPHAPETMFQPGDVVMKTPDSKTKSSPEVSYEPSDIKSTQGQPHAPEMMFQQWDGVMKTPDATKSSSEMSSGASDMKSTQDQPHAPETIFQQWDGVMKTPDATKSSPEVSYEPSDMKSTQGQPHAPEMMFQQWDDVMKTPDSKTKSSPEVSYEPSDIKSTQGQPHAPEMMFQQWDGVMKTPDATKSSSEMSSGASDMKSTKDQPHAPETMFQPWDVVMKTPDAKTKSPSEVSYEPSDMKSTQGQPHAPETMFQPGDVVMKTPEDKTKSSPSMSYESSDMKSTQGQPHAPEMMFQQWDDVMKTPDATKSSPEMSYEPSDMKSTQGQPHAPETMFQQWDGVMKTPDATKSSSEMSSGASDMKSTKDQPHAPETMFQQWDGVMKTPDATKSSPEVSYEPSDMKSTQGQPHAPEMMFQQWDDVMKTPDATKSSPEMSFEPSDMKSTKDQPHAPEMMFQPWDVVMKTPDATKSSPEMSFEPSDMKSTKDQPHAPEMMFQPWDVVMKTPDATKSSPEMSFEPSDMKSTKDQPHAPEMMFQPWDVVMKTPDATKSSPEMSSGASDMKSTQGQPHAPEMMFQPWDVVMKTPDATKSSPSMSYGPSDMQSTQGQPHAPEMMFQPWDVVMKTPDATKSSPEMSFEPSDMKSTQGQPHAPEMMFQPWDVVMKTPDAKTKSSPEMSSGASDMKSTKDQPHAPEMMFQPWDVVMKTPDATKSSPEMSSGASDMKSTQGQPHAPEMMFQPWYVVMKTPDATKSSPEMSSGASDMQSTKDQPHAPEMIFQPWDVVMKTPDAKTKSPSEVPYQRLDTVVQSTKSQSQPPDVASDGVMKSTNVQSQLPYQPSDMIMQTPDVKTKPSPEFSFLPPKNMISFPSIMMPPSNNMMQPSNNMMQPSNNMIQPSNNIIQSSDNMKHPSNIMVLSSDNMRQPSDNMMQASNGMKQPTESSFPKSPAKPSEVPKMLPTIPAKHVGSSKQPPHTKSEPLYIPIKPVSVPKESPKAPVQSAKQPTNDHTQSINAPHFPKLPSRPPDTSGANTPPQPLYHLLDVPKRTKPCAEHNKKHQGHHKKNRFFSHFPLPSEKRNKHKNRHKTKKSLCMKNSAETDDDIEYLAWSTMPAVRRQLNKLEVGLELDNLFSKNPKLKKMSNAGEDSPV